MLAISIDIRYGIQQLGGDERERTYHTVLDQTLAA